MEDNNSFNPLKDHIYNITTNEIKDIVRILNKEPFSENFTLVSFDELSKKKLLNLLTRVFSKLDQKFEIDFEEATEEEKAKLSDFLSMLSYPDVENEKLINKVYQGCKKHIYPIFYYILQNFEELKNRAYLGYYLVPLNIPDEYMMDLEMKNVFDQYSELREVFKAEHEELEIIKKSAPKYNIVEQELLQLEKERDQLKVKLKTFQHKKTQTKEFKDLLESVAKLRKAQEEEAKLLDKLNNQKTYLDHCEQIMLSVQQRLLDAQRAYGQETSASDMLSSLRYELKSLKKETNEIKFELIEKSNKFTENEKKLSENVPHDEMIKKMDNSLIQLRSNIMNLETKIKEARDPSKEDKLSIFRQQAAMVVKKKEDLKEEIKNLEEERTNFEIEIEEKKKEIEKNNGPGSFKKKDFEQFQENLNKKISIQKKNQKELQEIEQEIGILKRTEKIFKKLLKKSIEDVKVFERKYGIDGLLNIENEIEDLSKKKGNLDLLKGKTLEELSSIVEQLKLKIEEKRDSLKPLIDKHKIIKNEINSIKDDHAMKKQEFDHVLSSVKKEYEHLKNKSRQKKEEYFQNEISIDLYKEKGRVLDLVYKFLEEENEFSEGENQLSEKYQCYRDMMQGEIEECDKEIQILKVERDKIKQNTDYYLENTEMMKKFQFLLEEKLKYTSLKNTNNSFKTTTYNRVVLE